MNLLSKNKKNFINNFNTCNKNEFVKKSNFRFSENSNNNSNSDNLLNDNSNSGLKEDNPEEIKFNINIKKKENFRILQDYFYEGQVDATKVLPKSNREEMNLLNIPEYRELYKNFSVVINDQQLNELDEIKHDVLENDKKYKYGLMAKNEMNFNEIIVFNQEEAIPKTATESLFELLNMDKDSSYEGLVLKFRNEFQHGKLNLK
jgi:hypothetical protein